MAVLLRREGQLARITLAKPPLNVLDRDHLEVLGDLLEEADDASVLVIDGGPSRAFCAGNDVRDHAPERAPSMLEAFHRAIRLLLATDAVTVADVRGDALGAGCEIVAACDLAYASPGAHFGQPEIDVGCFPPVAASLLPARVGRVRAAEMLFCGRRIDAAAAAAWGLICRVDDRGAEEAVRLLCRKSGPVLRAAKAAFRAGTLERAEEIYRKRVLPLEDCAEGVAAFLAKRPPQWRNR